MNIFKLLICICLILAVAVSVQAQTAKPVVIKAKSVTTQTNDKEPAAEATASTKEDNKVYDRPQVPAEFSSLNEWIAQNIGYPTELMNEKVRGKIFFNLIIEKDGSISEVTIFRSFNGQFTGKQKKAIKKSSEEMVGKLKAMPSWTPAKHNGQTVRSKLILPIEFQS